MKIHELKILPKWFGDVTSGVKNFEIRKNDRDYKVGDYLILKEWDNDKYTGNFVTRYVEYIYEGDGAYGLSEGYCILGLKDDGDSRQEGYAYGFTCGFKAGWNDAKEEYSNDK